MTAEDQIYLVLKSYHYEGDEVIASFTVPLKAHEFAKKQASVVQYGGVDFEVVAVIPNTEHVIYCASYPAAMPPPDPEFDELNTREDS